MNKLATYLFGAIFVTIIFSMTGYKEREISLGGGKIWERNGGKEWRKISMDTTKPEKIFTVGLTLNKWVQYSNGLAIMQQQLKQSDLPSRTVSVLIDSIIAPLQIEIGSQVNRQIADTTKPKNK